MIKKMISGLIGFAIVLQMASQGWGSYALDQSQTFSSPIASWKLNENTGNVANDSSGNGYNGSIAGANWTSWRGQNSDSSALGFDGTVKTVDVNVPNCNLNIGASFTISAWIKAPVASQFRVLLAKGTKIAGHFEIYLSPNNLFQFYSPDLGDFSSNTVVADNSWHYIAVTYDGSKIMMYVDGIKKASHSASGKVEDSTNELHFGSLLEGGLAYDGVIDEVRIYNRPLNAAEIHSDETTQTTPTTMACWHFNENIGTNANDSSGNGYNCVFSGVKWVTGKYGSALNFGDISIVSTDYVSVPNCNLNLGAKFTLSTWIKAPKDSKARIILAKGAKSDPGHFEFNLKADNKLQFYAPNLGTFDSTNAVADNQWHFVVVSYDGSNVIVYVDGIAQTSQSASGTIDNSVSELRFGTLIDGTLPYSGLIGEINIYNITPTLTEIQNLYAQELRYTLAKITTEPTTSGLLDEWKFEGQDDRVIAESTHKYDGIMHSVTWETGRVGNALQFYGTSEITDTTRISYGQVPNFADTLGASFTISLLVKSMDYHMLHQKKTLLAKGTSGPGSFSLYTDAEGFLHFVSSDLGRIASKIQVFLDSDWHHLAVTYNGSQLSLIVDGYIVNTSSTSGSVANLMDTLYFGGITSGDFYVGLMDQVRIYNRQLSMLEIYSLLDENAAPTAPIQKTGTIVAKVDCGTATDGLDGFSADKAFVEGSWGYVDDGASISKIFQQNTYSIYGGLYMFKSRRESTSNLSYKFTVPNGSYKVNLYFTEADKTQAGKRTFDVNIENLSKLTNYDIFADAKEKYVGVMKQFTGIQVSDGVLNIDFIKGIDNISIAGIDVQKDDGVVLASSAPLKIASAPLFIDPPIKKQLRDSSSIYNKYTGKWMHFGLLQNIDDSFKDDSIAAVEMTNNGRGPWTWIGIPTGLSTNDFAPDIVYDSETDTYHMFTGSLSEGLRHYVNTDHSLMNWSKVSSNCVPGKHPTQWDPEVWKTGDTWHMVTSRGQYDSIDLYTWTEHQNSLKARWLLSYGVGGWDATDNGNDITFTGVTWGEGKSNDAVSFNGSSGCNGRILNSKLNLGDSFTITAWIKAPAASSNRVIMAKGAKTVAGHFEMNLKPDNKLMFYAPSMGSFSSTNVVADDNWHHVAVSYNGSTIVINIDGVDQAPQSATGKVADSTCELRFGSLIDGSLPYKGILDEVHIYDRAIDLSEIKSLMTAPITYTDKYNVPHFENVCIFKFNNMWWSWNDQDNTIYKSSDGITNWTPCDIQRNVSINSGRVADRGYYFGCDAIVQNGRCFLTYGVLCEEYPTYTGYGSKVALQVVEAKEIDGNLYMDGNAPFDFDLVAGLNLDTATGDIAVANATIETFIMVGLLFILAGFRLIKKRVYGKIRVK